MADSRLPIQSLMPEWAIETIRKFTPQVGEMITRAYSETIIRGLSEGAPEADVRNHAISVMSQLSSVGILAMCEQLSIAKPGIELPVLADVAMSDVELRFRRAITIAVTLQSAAADGEGATKQ